MAKLGWKEELRGVLDVSDYWERDAPVFIQYFEWCWHRPIYIGLPLAPLFAPLMILEIVALAVTTLARWGRE